MKASGGFLRLLGSLFGGSLGLILRFGSAVELGCHEDDALIFLAVGTGPFLGLEVAGDGDVLAFLEAVEGVEAFVLAPCLDVDEG